MSISADIDVGNIGVGVGDSVIIDGQGSIIGPNRYAVSAMSLYNPIGGVSVDVTLYRTSDNTSAGGVEIAFHTIPVGESVDICEIIGQGYIAGTSIVATGDSAGTSIDSTVTIYEDL